MVTEEELAKKKQNTTGMSTKTKLVIILVAVSVFFIVWNFVFGGVQSFYQLIIFIVSFVAIAGLTLFIFQMMKIYLSPDQFSPKKDYFNRLVNLAQDMKPSNLRDLYFMGSKDKKRIKAGKITGCLGIPYLIGEIKKHENDVYDKDNKLIAKKGSIVYEQSRAIDKKIPVFSKIEYGEDGDTFFIYEAGWFLFKRRHYLRCHKALHGDLNGDVDIYDINPVPYGAAEYPFKQMQRDPAKIMIQNQMEVILATHEHQYDLISQGVDSAVYFNPYFRLLQKSQMEMSDQQG